jgi:hypothetical protein
MWIMGRILLVKNKPSSTLKLAQTNASSENTSPRMVGKVALGLLNHGPQITPKQKLFNLLYFNQENFHASEI